MDNQIEELQARANLYRLFGPLLFREVSEEWLNAFQNGLKEEWSALGCEFDEDVNADVSELKEKLDAEFTSMWLAPGGVPRFESIFETGMLFQTPCDKVSELYQQEGFTFDADKEKSFPDHAGVELEFMGLLLGNQAKALTTGNADEAKRLNDVFHHFLVNHAGTWVPAMMNYSAQAAQHSFYRELCKMILSFLASEIQEELPRREREKLLDDFDREPKELDYDADFRKASGL